MKAEFFRESIHLMLGIFFIAIAQFLSRTDFLLIAGLVFSIGLFTALLLRFDFKIPYTVNALNEVDKIVSLAERKEEKNFPGLAAFIFVLGVLLAGFFFNNPLTLTVALIPLTFGDSIATIIGERHGKIKIGRRTLEGSLAGITASAVILSLFIPINLSIAIAVIAMASEYLPFNDNLVIPLASGIAFSYLTGL